MDNQGVTAQTDAAATTVRTPRAARLSGLFGSEARQKLLAFASLILLLIYFSFASPAFMQTDNMINILQATAVNGVLAIASTFIIITAGIDLSLGTLMTFTAVMAGVFLTYWGLPMWTGVLAALATGAIAGSISGSLIAKLKIPPFIATLGMMQAWKGFPWSSPPTNRSISTTPKTSTGSPRDSLIGYVAASWLPIPTPD
jgi:ribose transport system permease protein